VNNVGVSYDFPDFVARLTEERVDALLELNVRAVTEMCRLVLPGTSVAPPPTFRHWGKEGGSMVSWFTAPGRTRPAGMVERKRGAIINVSSASGNAPTPLLSIYSATKAYMDFFSQGLAAEYGRSGIFVQVHTCSARRSAP
jgi:17beta-estradiol 17-dehydrogenase / very-long-chain 3-oxoacyl-CoA reductase